MNKISVTALMAGIVLGLSSPVVAQLDNQTQNQSQGFKVTGDCVMKPMNTTDSEAPFMTCQYTAQEDADSQSLMDQMMRRMQEMMEGQQEQNQGMQGQGMGGQ